jgi:hypothetical protein
METGETPVLREKMKKASPVMAKPVREEPNYFCLAIKSSVAASSTGPRPCMSSEGRSRFI